MGKRAVQWPAPSPNINLLDFIFTETSKTVGLCYMFSSEMSVALNNCFRWPYRYKFKGLRSDELAGYQTGQHWQSCVFEIFPYFSVKSL